MPHGSPTDFDTTQTITPTEGCDSAIELLGDFPAQSVAPLAHWLDNQLADLEWQFRDYWTRSSLKGSLQR